MKSMCKIVSLACIGFMVLTAAQYKSSKQPQSGSILDTHYQVDTSIPEKPPWLQLNWGQEKALLQSVPGMMIKFDKLEINDTIYAKDLELRNYKSGRKYVFPFTFVTAPQQDFLLLVNRSYRPDGADPDYNSYYPKKPMKIGDRDSIVIWAPIIKGNYPYIRRYVANTTAENRDTLIFRQVYIDN
ncbi:MAG: hypothetical protein MK212_02945 [Saprospiraceae bacterium]|nr:hypothetical protein [Saprospiraceae bacterium]